MSPGPALVGFQLGERGGFDLPPLGVELREFGGWRRDRIGDGGEEPVGAFGGFEDECVVGAGVEIGGRLGMFTDHQPNGRAVAGPRSGIGAGHPTECGRGVEELLKPRPRLGRAPRFSH